MWSVIKATRAFQRGVLQGGVVTPLAVLVLVAVPYSWKTFVTHAWV